jgi:hypothetical protein
MIPHKNIKLMFLWARHSKGYGLEAFAVNKR